MTMLQEQWEQLARQAGEVFTPATPIDEKALFAGRTDQLLHVVDAINRRGTHAILFGERGVGKTSLANVLSQSLEAAGKMILAPHVNCDGGDTYTSLWRKVFKKIQLSQETRAVGFQGGAARTLTSLAERFPSEIAPDDVRESLTVLGKQAVLIVVIDEFDRLPAKTSKSGASLKTLVADTVKALSDYAAEVTLVLVGVADSVDELIAEHQSIERALVQIRMPRMSLAELHQLLQNGLTRLGMTIEEEALGYIALLSRGLPHYAHLLGLHASREAVAGGVLHITRAHADAAIQKALTQAQQSIRSAYHKATTSPRKDNLYGRVLLACALADTDEMGYFAAGDVRTPMTRIMERPFEIPRYAQHLNAFCEPARGPVLQRTGSKHRHRFRFMNPLMQPFVMMQGIADGTLRGVEIPRLRGNGR